MLTPRDWSASFFLFCFVFVFLLWAMEPFLPLSLVHDSLSLFFRRKQRSRQRHCTLRKMSWFCPTRLICSSTWQQSCWRIRIPGAGKEKSETFQHFLSLSGLYPSDTKLTALSVSKKFLFSTAIWGRKINNYYWRHFWKSPCFLAKYTYQWGNFLNSLHPNSGRNS